jgi:hypothetical protein
MSCGFFGTGIENGIEDAVFRNRICLHHRDDAFAAEVVGHTARVTHGATVARHDSAHICGSAVFVVGEAFDEQSDTRGRVSLVDNRLVVDGVAKLAGATLDSVVNVRVGDRRLLGLLDGVDQSRVSREVCTTNLGCDFDVFDEFGERLCTALILDRLLVLGGCPFGVA